MAAGATRALAAGRAGPRSARSDALAFAAVALGAAALGAVTWRCGLRAGLVLYGPHRVEAPRARLDGVRLARIERALAAQRPRDVRAALAFALDEAGRGLRFGLWHHGSLRFTEAPRRAHCVEYAHLCAHVFALAARAGRVDAEALVVRSDASWMGWRSDRAALRDHDWVLVRERGARRCWFVDPSFDDALAGWDLRASVRGAPALCAGAGLR